MILSVVSNRINIVDDLMVGIFLLLSVGVPPVFGQSNQSIADIIYLDSLVVSATKGTFSVEEFMELVRADTTFL